MKKTNNKKITSKKDKAGPALLREAKALLGKVELTEALAEMHADKNGELGFLLKVLKERPRNFNRFLLKGMAIYKEPAALDRKTTELVAVGVAAALRCDHCLEAHIGGLWMRAHRSRRSWMCSWWQARSLNLPRFPSRSGNTNNWKGK